MSVPRMVLSLALVAALVPAAAYAGKGKGCGEKHVKCPMMVEGADVKVENTATGAVITVTSQDPEKVKKIQENAKSCQEACQPTAAAQGTEMATCPVMGVKIEKSKAAAVREHKGKTYYLCCADCVAKFDADPDKYAK